MTWDATPWAVGGGAVHSADLARALAYVASGGAVGVVNFHDLRVLETTVPSEEVRVLSGAGMVPNHHTGATAQSYAVYLPSQDQIAIAPTGGSARKDMVVVRVEDPQYPPWEEPPDYTAAQFVFTRVLEDVPAGADQAWLDEEGYAALALARIEIPSSTATITDAMIVDLRSVAQPKSQRMVLTAHPSVDDELTSATLVDWPDVAQWTVVVPMWATRATIIGTVFGVYFKNGGAFGTIQVDLDAQSTDASGWDGEATELDVAFRTTVGTAGTLSLPDNYQGQSKLIRFRGLKTAGAGEFAVDDRSTIVCDVQFEEVAG